MGSDRVQLPHETDRVFLTDGGTETQLMHKRGLEVPHFSSFHLLKCRAGSEAVRAYDRAFADIAVEHGTFFIIAGADVAARLATHGAVLIEGAKAVGKTTTGLALCASHVRLDRDAAARAAANADPRLVLDGSTTRSAPPAAPCWSSWPTAPPTFARTVWS